jgi:hypothetical protein
MTGAPWTVAARLLESHLVSGEMSSAHVRWRSSSWGGLLKALRAGGERQPSALPAAEGEGAQ